MTPAEGQRSSSENRVPGTRPALAGSPAGRVPGASLALDTLLDRTVVGGYTKLGYRVRQRWFETPLPRLDGKVVLITGATGGLGLAAAEALAGLGATLWVAVRDIERGDRARARIVERSGSDDVNVARCDLSSMDSVRRFTAELRAQTTRLDVLINNAGVLPSRRETSADGIELALATNVIGPFLLSAALLPLLQATADEPAPPEGAPEAAGPARIINVSSGGIYTQKIRVDDLQSEGPGFDGAGVYARTKRAEVILTEMLAECLAGTGVVVHSMHPGWTDTAGIRSALPRFHRLARPLLRSVEEGADTIVWLACAEEPAASSGGFWHDRRRRPTHLLPWTHETAQERSLLWTQCLSLSGLPADWSPLHPIDL